MQNLVLLVASYVFYGYWDWRFLGLLILVTGQTYIFGYLITANQSKKKEYLTSSILINIFILGVFKYFNFFYSELIGLLPPHFNYATLNIILPVGISFYIFQTFTYVIDIYNKKIVPEPIFVNYATFVAFFPQLVAGPIERASNLLPQFNRISPINWDVIYTGIKIIIVGLFLKIFIADNLEVRVQPVFDSYSALSGGSLLLGAIYFSIQIYGDFCGYSLIAIGVAKCIGFDLMSNFNTPYFSTSMQDFWRRWHISLSSFFRDYIYIPLGGSRKSTALISRNLIFTFTLSGLWHGANWTFIAWGFFHGLLLIFQRLTRLDLGKSNVINYIVGWALTMSTWMVLLIIFRSESVSDALQYIKIMLVEMDIPTSNRSGLIFCGYYLLVDSLLIRNHKLEKPMSGNQYLETIILSLMILMVIGSLDITGQEFIYFQF